MIVDGGFTVDTMMSDPGCTYSNTDVVNAINEGRSYLNYRGEGWTTGWWATCTPMTNTQVSGLANGQKFTFVTSIGCGVAMFASGESFGETWLELGTISNPRGAAAFIGPAGNTHTTYNNKIDKGIYVGMLKKLTLQAEHFLEVGFICTMFMVRIQMFHTTIRFIVLWVIQASISGRRYPLM
ncbi:MAG: C25 family cysteine peptidase [Bacteroidales bacterium]